MRNAPSTFLVLLVLAFAVGAHAAEAPAAMPLRQVWTGILEPPPDNQNVGIGDIEVKTWALSSDREIQTLVEELRGGGQDGLRQAIFRLEQKGWVRIGKAAATSIGLVRVVDLPDGKRRLRLVSAFPARVLDWSDPAGSRKHPFAFLELTVDRDGTAEGRMIAAASISFVENGIRVDSAGAPVLQIFDVATDSPPR